MENLQKKELLKIDSNQEIIDNIVGPLVDFKADEDGNMTIPVDYYEVNGRRMSLEQYNDWKKRKEKEFYDSICKGRTCIEDFSNEIRNN